MKYECYITLRGPRPFWHHFETIELEAVSVGEALRQMGGIANPEKDRGPGLIGAQAFCPIGVDLTFEGCTWIDVIELEVGGFIQQNF